MSEVNLVKHIQERLGDGFIVERASMEGVAAVTAVVRRVRDGKAFIARLCLYTDTLELKVVE